MFNQAFKQVRWLFDSDPTEESGEEKAQDKDASSSGEPPKSILKDTDGEKKRDSKRLSFGRGGKEETKTKRVSWRQSWNKGKRSSADSRSNKSKLDIVSNLGAINEDGEYAQAKLEDSNIVGIGSSEDRELRKAAAKTDRAFNKAGKKVGLEIWRVENKRTKNGNPDFGIKRWPKEEYGSFYSGDSYIILNTYHPIDPLTKKKNKTKMAWDVHFWLGKESTQDEITVAAYKTVELDTLLDDGPVQHREVQYHESKLFMSYFKEVNYMDGGIESGFRHVKPTQYEPRLLIVRHVGKVTKSFQIPCKSKYMNHGDCFILDTGLTVYRWVGEKSNVFEKNKSGLLQHNIVNSRNGKACKADPDDRFWEILGDEKHILPHDKPYEVESGNDDRLDATSIKLYRISDASGTMSFSLEAQGSVPFWKLDSDDVFLIHSNIGLWIWLGSRATQNEKSNSMAIADKYLKDHNLPNTMTVTVTTEDSAKTNALFQGLFQGR